MSIVLVQPHRKEVFTISKLTKNKLMKKSKNFLLNHVEIKFNKIGLFASLQFNHQKRWARE